MLLNRTRVVMLLNRTGGVVCGPETSLRYPFSRPWALVHKNHLCTYDLCVMLLMRAASITWARGRGLCPENFDFFRPEMELAYRLDAISQGQNKTTC
jgi:hypothetical protein